MQIAGLDDIRCNLPYAQRAINDSIWRGRL